MPKKRTTSEPVPPITNRPLRQILSPPTRSRSRLPLRCRTPASHRWPALPRHCSGSLSPWRLPAPAVSDAPFWRLLGFNPVDLAGSERLSPTTNR
jgi:hypothetical protein